MVNFKNRLVQKKLIKTDPIQIYEALDRSSEKGPLRSVQEVILKDWSKNYRNEKDTILKLHTGQGKTIIGLLILQSNLNSGVGPSIYVCPNKQLVEQVCEQADSFGIPYCTIGSDRELPSDFLNEKKMLITHVQKLFNGLTVFKTGAAAEQAGSIILDDSHTCISYIKDASSIKLENQSQAYTDILNLFDDDLKKQGLGTFAEIKNKEIGSYLKVPYWSWSNKIEEVSRILANYTDSNAIKYAWPLIKDDLIDCQCIISGLRLEITPNIESINKFATFTKARHRIFMSATVNDDSAFIKTLGVSKKTILNPLAINNEKWSGEKMILIPSLISSQLKRETIVSLMGKSNNQRKYGSVVLTPSFNRTEDWKSYGSSIADSKTINHEISKLKNKDFSKTLVIANRYDGIDLPDHTCRILIMDSLPHFEKLEDKYKEDCIGENKDSFSKLSQIIEQGLGRGVRGEKDYCAIILIGPDLIRVLRNKKIKRYFSPQTQMQLEIGEEIVKMTEEEINKGENPQKVLSSLIVQSLNRDEGWKEYYTEQMNSLTSTTNGNALIDLYILEYNAEQAYLKDDRRCLDYIQEIIDKYTDSTEERGWYLQQKARYALKFSIEKSQEFQKSAYRTNKLLLKPEGILVDNKIKNLSVARIQNIIRWLNQFSDYKELKIELDSILGNLQFGINADKFEKALDDLGNILGFTCSRPDKEFKEGPDNLWKLDSSKYILFECKNNVKVERDEVNKHETGQMNNSCAWFKRNFQTENVKNILIIPTKNIASAAGFNDEVRITKKNKLNMLTSNVRSFYQEFSNKDLQSISDHQIQDLLSIHKLEINDFWTNYYDEEPYLK
jgi:replicative superfamily II helicase